MLLINRNLRELKLKNLIIRMKNSVKDMEDKDELFSLKIKMRYSPYWASLVAQTVKLLPATQEEKGTTEGKMVGWHHQLDGHEFE